MKRSVRSSCGAVLVITLWVLAMLSAIALGLSYRTGLEIKRTGALNDKVRSLAACQAGIQRMIYELEKDRKGFDTLSDAVCNSRELFDKYRLETGSYTIACERMGFTDDSKGTIFYGAMDEESKINVSTATSEMWDRLLKIVELSPDIKDAILDWVDTDNSARFHGAEASDYAIRTHPYRPRNGRMLMLEELTLVKDITPDVYEKLAPYLTVYGDGKVNINTASPAVLEILGIPPELVFKIARYRRGLDGKEGTGDDGVFRNLESILASLEITESLSNTDRFAINNCMALLTVGSRFFRIHVRGESRQSGGVATRVTAVLERFPSGQRMLPRVVFWSEG